MAENVSNSKLRQNIGNSNYLPKKVMNKVCILLTIIGLLCSCSNEDDDVKTKEIEINVIINNSNTYEYHLGSFGDEEGAEIQIQAAHFEISELIEYSNDRQVVYKYRPTPGYVGNDYVEITAERGSDGSGPNTNIIILKITFNIIE